MHYLKLDGLAVRAANYDRAVLITVAFRSLFLWRKYFLRAHLLDEMLALYVSQVSPFFIVGQIGTNALGHDHHKSAIIHVHPI